MTNTTLLHVLLTSSSDYDHFKKIWDFWSSGPENACPNEVNRFHTLLSVLPTTSSADRERCGYVNFVYKFFRLLHSYAIPFNERTLPFMFACFLDKVGFSILDVGSRTQSLERISGLSPALQSSVLCLLKKFMDVRKGVSRRSYINGSKYQSLMSDFNKAHSSSKLLFRQKNGWFFPESDVPQNEEGRYSDL